ncbi:MAG: leucine-rich repeat domain-containing protein, partial [Oscillospiraceae bacterium]|nr:leucine-rich repeat domain-containing protein [Oscillospiraceae bacterium]
MKKLKAKLAFMTALSMCTSYLPTMTQVAPDSVLISAIAEDGEDTESTEEIATSGTCGENLTWEFDEETGTLTISGTGAMTDWEMSEDSPWFYNENIKEVIIEDGVTTIGDYAFYECSTLESVTIPDSMTIIGDHTFSFCKSLTSITIPDGVTAINNTTFQNC